jgi:hypothetical protein
VANKHIVKLKQQRRAERLDEKQIHKAATVAAQHSFAIAMYCVKAVFKERASNPKMEEFIVKMLSTWEKIGDGKVSINTIVASVEAESGILYDLENGEIRNLKGKGA